MSAKLSTASANGILNGTGIKEQLDGGFLFFFAGPVPASADDALDMDNDHTEIAKFTESADGTTGLTFDAPTDGALAKAAAESWQSNAAFDGAEDGESSLTATFFRFCAAGDDGRGAANTSTGYRVQGTIGSLTSGADLRASNPVITDEALVPIAGFAIRAFA